MKTNEATIFIFIACIIVGIMISSNMNLGDKTPTVLLNVKEYQDKYNLRNKLYNDISGLNKSYNEGVEKLEKYKNADADNDDIVKDIKNQLDKNKLILGKLSVEGEGIRIVLNDASSTFNAHSIGKDYRSMLIHDNDIFMIMNDLKNAGAEAISINGQRIISGTGIFCGGPFMNVNGIKLPSPFYIDAIGNKEALQEYMLRDENFLKFLMIRGIKVKLSTAENIRIPAYVGKIKNEHTKILEK